MLPLTHDYAAQARAASGMNILLGLWLIASPWVFDYSARSAVVSSVCVGALIALLAAMRIATLPDSAGLSGINVLLALWTIGSPWACGYAENVAATTNNVILGIVIAALAIWSASATLAAERHPPPGRRPAH
jgi:SPW repeat